MGNNGNTLQNPDFRVTVTDVTHRSQTYFAERDDGP